MKNMFKNQQNMMINWRYVIFMAASCLCTSNSVLAQQNWQTQSEMEAVASKFLHQHFGDQYELNLKFGKLDNRIKLARCNNKLRA